MSKALKEARYPQDDSYFSWGNFTGEWRITSVPADRIDEYASPTADEILDRLPRSIRRNGKDFWLEVETQADGIGWAAQYKNINHPNRFFEEKEIADCAARMWLYLKKEGLI